MKEKAFIFLLKSPRNYYVYDVNRDTLLSVDKNVYEYLANGENKAEIGNNSVDKKIIELKEKGYLSENKCKRIEHPDSPLIAEQLDGYIEQLVLQVTQSCNLLCYYCPYANFTDNTLQRNHSSKQMTLETAIRAVDFYLEHSYGTDKFVISFYGGEPLLAFELIKKIVTYVEENALGKEINFNMTTNGTLLDSEKIDYLVEHQFDVMFSIDGPEVIHDVNRKKSNGRGSFQEAFSNFLKMIKAYGDECVKRVSINMVINPENDLDTLFGLFNEPVFSEHEISVASTLADTDQLEKKIEANEEYYEKMNYQYFLGLLEHLEIIQGIKVAPFIRKYYIEFDKDYSSFKSQSLPIPEVSAPSGPCLPGKRRLFVNADGDFFPCERVSEVSEVMKIGNIEDGFDNKKIYSLLNIGKLTESKCINCWAQRHCVLCARDADGGDELSADVKNRHCETVKANYLDKLRDYILFKEARTIYKKEMR